LDPLTLRAKSWHVLPVEAVEALRESGTGGIAYCMDCGHVIAVPGESRSGIVMEGLRRFLNHVPIRGVGV
jgi:hypothetical protein